MDPRQIRCGITSYREGAAVSALVVIAAVNHRTISTFNRAPYLPTRFNSFGGAIQSNSPTGGDTRFNSITATPDFFSAVQSRRAPNASAIMSSTCGPCPNKNTSDESL